MKTIRCIAFLLTIGVSCQAAFAGTFKPGEDGEKEISSVTVSRGSSHTFILSGIDSENSAIMGWEVYGTYTYKEEGETYEDVIYVYDDGWEENGGKETWYFALSAEDWPDEAPSSVKFHVVLNGWPYDKDDDPQPDREYSFSHQDGYYLPAEPEPAIPVGAAENPASLTVVNKLENPSVATYTPPVDGSYYFKTTLTAERKYYFGVLDAEGATNSIFIGFSQTGDNLFLDEKQARSYTNAVGTVEWDDCAQAYVFVPKTTSLYHLVVTTSSGSCRLKTAMLPARSPAEHDELKGILTEGADPVVCTPGHLNRPDSGAYDAVIDECLFAFVPESGSTYVFESSGADTNLLMRLYDASGAILANSCYMAIYDRNCRIVWTAPVARQPATVYLGICQRFDHKRLIDEEEEVTTAGPVSLTVRSVDVNDPAVPLTVVQAGFDEQPQFVEKAVPATNQVFSAVTRKRTYLIAARQGITYRLKAVSADASGLLLGANVTAVRATLSVSGSLDPNYEGELAIVPTANDTIKVEVGVAEGEWGDGEGLDYGPFDLYAVGSDEDNTYGTLKVDMLGAPETSMTWKIGTENMQYPNGTSVLLPEGTYSITPVKITGYAAPTAQSVAVAVAEVRTQVYKYTDTADPLDNFPVAIGSTKYAAKSMTPSAKGVSFDRSLWGDDQNYDPADWFSFKAAEGTYYKFSLSNVVGAPKITVYDWNLAQGVTNVVENVLCEEENAWQISVGPEGKNKTYYVCVSHADGEKPTDSAYTLTATSVSVGSLKFEKTTVKAKEDDAAVTLKVNRTAKEGRVRIRYRTVEGTAKPGDRYYPMSGELTWEDGDNKAKTISVRLIPDETPTYVNGEAATFSVKLETLAPEEVEAEEGEYIPAISGGDTATVEISETAKATPGTIVTADYAINGTPGVFADPKKPSVAVRRGDTFALYVRRESGASGANGAVGVEVSAKAGTANKAGDGTDYVTPSPVTKIWADGDAATFCTFEVKTLANANDPTATKSFTVNLKALTADPADPKTKLASATIPAKSVTVTIENVETKTVTDYMKDKTTAAELKASGVTGIKESKTGAWILDADGNISANVVQTASPKPTTADLSFTLTGPGRFTFKPFVQAGCEGLMTWTCTGKPATSGVCVNGVPVTLYLATGSQTVKVTGLTGCGLKAQDGQPYKWEPLPTVSSARPTVDKAVVAAGDVKLAFTRSDIPDVGYAVYVLDAAEKKLKLGAPETELKMSAGEYVTNVTYTVGNKGVYTWRVDSFFVGGPVTNAAMKACTLNVLKDELYGGLLPPSTQVVGEDAWGRAIDAVGGTNIVLKQGVKATLSVGEANSTVKQVSGKLPDGLKLEQDKSDKRYYVRGTPSKSGTFAVLLQETDAKKHAGTTTALDITVDALMGTAVGTFSGVVTSGSPTNGIARAAQITFTATSAGKLSASVQVAGKKYSFADTGYSYLYGDRDSGKPQLLHAKLSQIQKVGKETFTNVLHVAVVDRAEADPEALTLEGQVRLDMNCLPDAKGNGYQEGILYEEGGVYRDNAKVAAWVTKAAALAGYYTVALVPVSAYAGEPRGNGFLTLTVDAKGKVKLAGQLADGVTVPSASSSLVLMSDNGFCVPVYYLKGTELVAGCLQLVDDPSLGAPVVFDGQGESRLRWYNDDPNSTEEGEEGFALDLSPAGGWYDTVFNLQRHYLDYAFKISMPGVEELPLNDVLTAAGYAFVPSIGPDGMQLSVAGNAFSTEKQQLVKQIDPTTGRATTYNDWTASVNPQNVQFKYVRATGLIKGTSFTLWYEGYKKQGQNLILEQKSVAAKPEGVMVINRAAGSALADDVIVAGYFTLDVDKFVNGTLKTRKWKASFPFDVRLEYTGNDFTE